MSVLRRLLAALAVVVTVLPAAGCAEPSWRAAVIMPSTAAARVDRASVQTIACRYDQQAVPCGDYLFRRLLPMMENRPNISDLVVTQASAQCRMQGPGTLCELSARVRFTQGGRSWPVRVDMRYRAPVHQPYVAQARSAADPLSDPSVGSLAPMRDVLDRLVASIIQESERAARLGAS
jgi:hypothetical protein